MVTRLNRRPDHDPTITGQDIGEIGKINLLPFNESEGIPFRRPSDETIEIFQKILWKAGYTVLIRSSRGADISAACGQLAGKMNF